MEFDSIDCSAQPLDISFHPRQEHLVAAALVDGTLEVHDFSSQDGDGESSDCDTIVASIQVHTTPIKGSLSDKTKNEASCRAIRFSNDGSHIYTGGSCGDICSIDAETACSFNATPEPQWRMLPNTNDKKDGGIHVMHQLSEASPTGPLLATGSEEGCVRLWDQRLCGSCATNKNGIPRACVMSWDDHTDYISGFCQSHDATTLLTSSADGTLGVFDLRQSDRKQALRRSDDQEDELLSIAILKNGKKVICGSQEGVLNVWSWGVWEDISTRRMGHPASVDALLKVDEDTLLTGCSDGIMRLVQVLPDKLLGVMGDHNGFPIESLEFNSTKSHVGSVSHDNLIRLWNAKLLFEDDDDEEFNAEKEGAVDQATSNVSAYQRTGAKNGSDDEWEDEDDSSDSDSNNSDEDDGRNAKRARTFKTEAEKFFEDL